MNRIKTLVLAGVLAVFTVSMAAAKSLEITLSSPTKVGSVELKAGDYRLSLDGTKAKFTNVETLKTVTTDVKLEDGDTKFASTRLVIVDEGAGSVMKQIRIGGSKTKAIF
jgi:hypothetical protein